MNACFGPTGVGIVRRVVGIVVAVILVVTASAWAQTNTAIIAGQSLAGVRIGGSANDAISLWGTLYDRSDSDSGKYALYDWPLRPFTVVADKESGRIVLIGVALTDTYRTDRGGITGGAERQVVETAYGSGATVTEGQASTLLVYDSMGIAFFLGKTGVLNGRVFQIVVFTPGQWKAITEGQ